jgi:hypothetical protein
MKRILLTEEDLKTLLTGGVVTKNNTQLALQDIGYDRILKLLIEKINR